MDAYINDIFSHACAWTREYSKAARRAYYLTYNPLVDGDYRDAYYNDKRQHFPPEIEREAGKDYSKGGETYNLGNPIATKKIE
jgi:hypothetical protein